MWSAEVGPFDQFHHRGAHAARLLQTINRRNVGVIEGGEHLSLTLEARHALGIFGEGFGQDFQGDVAAQLRVPRDALLPFLQNLCDRGLHSFRILCQQ